MVETRQDGSITCADRAVKVFSLASLQYSRIAQLVECLALTQEVVGSYPTAAARRALPRALPKEW